MTAPVIQQSDGKSWRVMGGKESLNRHTEKLEEFLSAKNLTPLSPPTYAFYNLPGRYPSYVAMAKSMTGLMGSN